MARREKKKGKTFLKVGLFMLAAVVACAVAYFTGNPLLVRDILALFLLGGTGIAVGKLASNKVQKIKEKRESSDTRSRSVVRNRERNNELTRDEVYSMGSLKVSDDIVRDTNIDLKNESKKSVDKKRR